MYQASVKNLRSLWPGTVDLHKSGKGFRVVSQLDQFSVNGVDLILWLLPRVVGALTDSTQNPQ